MRTMASPHRRVCDNASNVALLLALLAGLVTLAACGGNGGSSAPEGSGVASAEFVQMASTASCANLRNRLFVVDEARVFWDRAGTCADAAYAQTLYGATPQTVLCSQADSIAGPQTYCPDAQDAALFHTIAQNMDKPDLGLGANHRVRPLDVPASATTALSFVAMSPRFCHGTPPTTIVIRDAAAWADFLRSNPLAGSPVFPEPDFSRQMVLGVSSRTANPCNLTRIVGIGSDSQQLTVEFLDEQRATLQACEPTGATPMSLVALQAMPLPARFVDVTSAQLQFRTLERSSHSAVTTPLTAVVKEQSDWSALWTRHLGDIMNGTPQPTVDLASRMVAAVFLGEQPTACHGIADLKVWRSRGRIHVAHFDTLPGPTMLCIPVITTPAVMVEIERSEEAVDFVAIATPL